MPPQGSTYVSGFDAPPISKGEFEQFRALIRKETGISLAPVKKDFVRTRLRKRLQHLGLRSFSEYHDYLCKKDPRGLEMVEMFNCITTNKTDFFREAHHFSFLEETAFPEIEERARRSGKRKLRIWSAACSTGQEPYSIAISIKEYFGRSAGWDTRILASDIDSVCLKTAAAGVYDLDRIEDVPLELKKRHFLRGIGDSSNKVSINSQLKDLITFRRINFADSRWPINTKFDIIFCRNAMIYFDREFQEQLLKKFIQLLTPQGYLILGHSENVSWMTDLRPVGKTIYRPAEGVIQRTPTISPVSRRPSTTPSKLPPILSSPKKTRTSTSNQVNNRSGMNAPTRVSEIRPDKRKSIVAGEVFASNERMEISTLLGSCIAACLYDPKIRAGGMNHFLLPTGSGQNADTACYGINAMELLINELMILGADRNRMVARIYGGGSVVGDQIPTSRVGMKNTDFVRQYLTEEGIPILDETLGGKHALRVRMIADTGEVNAIELDPSAARDLSQADRKAAAAANQAVERGDKEQITLF